MQPDITLILPAYNEAGAIAGAIAGAAEYFRGQGYWYEIVVAADGEDGTRERAREYARDDPAVKVIGNAERLGKGRGIREAVRIAAGRIVGFADADNKVPIEEYGKVAPWFEQGYDVVIGSRAIERQLIERKQPLYRRAGSQGFRVFMQAVVGLPGIGDTQCGFKFFRAEAARELFARQKIDGYMFDVEVLALAQRLGYRIKEAPVRWRDDADSRLELVSGNLRNVVDIFRIRAALRRV